MTENLDALILDLCEWIGPKPRPYAEVMEGWRTSCPQLAVWEEALDRGLVQRRKETDGEPVVLLTENGQRFLASSGRSRLAQGSSEHL